jgi:hypothetical protein
MPALYSFPRHPSEVLRFSIPLFLLHGLEETATGISSADGFLRQLGSGAAPFIITEIALVVALFLAAARFGGRRRTLAVLPVPVYLFEFQHVAAAVQRHGYYPGLVTSLLIGLMGLVYVASLLRGAGDSKR